MQLTYRGMAYQSPAISVELLSSQTGKYRGQTFQMSSTVLVLRQSIVAFKYRGVDYIQRIGDRYL